MTNTTPWRVKTILPLQSLKFMFEVGLTTEHVPLLIHFHQLPTHSLEEPDLWTNTLCPLHSMKPHPWRAESYTNLKNMLNLKATNSIQFPSKKKRFKRFREAMIERDAKDTLCGPFLAAFIYLATVSLFWVGSLAIEFKVWICPVQDSVMALVSWSNPEILQRQQKTWERNLRVLNLQDFNQPDLKLHLPPTVQHPQSFFPGLVRFVGSHTSLDRHFGMKESHAFEFSKQEDQERKQLQRKCTKASSFPRVLQFESSWITGVEMLSQTKMARFSWLTGSPMWPKVQMCRGPQKLNFSRSRAWSTKVVPPIPLCFPLLNHHLGKIGRFQVAIIWPDIYIYKYKYKYI